MLVIKDFATTTLAAALTAGATSIVVSDASRLPTLSAGDHFYLVLQKFTDRSYVEIVKVTGISSNTLTVVRAQAGTTAKAFAIADYAELRLTKGTFDEYLAQMVAGKVDMTSGYVNQKLDLLNTADSVKGGVGVVYDATNGHGTVLSGGEGANKLTPHILLRPLGMADDSVQALYDTYGSFFLSGGTRYLEAGRITSKHGADALGWPDNTPNSASNFCNRARQRILVGNNGLFFIADAGLNARRFGIQSGHEHPGYATLYGVLDLNPFGGVVRVNGGTVYHTGYVPTPAAVGALALSGGILTGTLDQSIGGYGGRMTAAGGRAYLQGGKVGGDTTDQKLKITGISATALTEFEIVTAGHGVARINGARIYTEQYVPTPAVLGVVPQARTINSKPLTSDIVIDNNDVGSRAGKVVNHNFGAKDIWYRVARVNIPQSVGSALITITGGVGFSVGQPDQAGLTHISIRSGNGTPKGLNMVAYRFHSALSPFVDFCYVPVSGDEYDIYFKCAGAYGNQLIFDFSYSSTASGVDYSLVAGTTTMPSGGVVGAIREIYTTAQKPTAVDVGAFPIVGGTATGAILTSVNDAMAIRARRAGYWAMMGCSNTAGEYIFGGGADSLTDYQHYVRIGNAKLQFQTSGNQYNIFHEGFVPTAAAVGAAPTGFGLGVTAMQKTAQDQTQAGFWRDSAITMAGITLPYDGSSSQAFIGVNTSQKRLKFGYRNGATTAPIEWFEAYSDNNKPTASALGVVPTTQLLPLAGGTVNWADLVGKVPVINNAGVTELGRYLDMREQGANVDFQWRWDAGAAGANRLSLYNIGGSPVIEFNASGRFHVPVNGGDINGRVKVYNGANPMYEWHIPGKYAAAAYLTAANDWRFVGSDGAGNETNYRFVSFADGRFITLGAVLSDHNTDSAWNSFNTASFRVNNIRPMANGAYCKLISHRMLQPSVFDLENSFGAFVDGSGWDKLCHTLVSTNGSDISRIWKFRNDGTMYGPTGNVFGSDGNSWGSVFGGSSLTSWAVNRFAPISDIRYKKNITECDGFALDVIEKFRFYAYDWDESKKIVAGKHHVRFGVSAQDMELIDEAYVKESEVHEVMGEDPVTIKTLDDSNLLTLALKAIQELKARVEFLESRAV